MVKAKKVGKRALSLFMAILMTASIFSGLGDVFGIQDMFTPTVTEAANDKSVAKGSISDTEVAQYGRGLMPTAWNWNPSEYIKWDDSQNRAVGYFPMVLTVSSDTIKNDSSFWSTNRNPVDYTGFHNMCVFNTDRLNLSLHSDLYSGTGDKLYDYYTVTIPDGQKYLNVTHKGSPETEYTSRLKTATTNNLTGTWNEHIEQADGLSSNWKNVYSQAIWNNTCLIGFGSADLIPYNTSFYLKGKGARQTYDSEQEPSDISAPDGPWRYVPNSLASQLMQASNGNAAGHKIQLIGSGDLGGVYYGTLPEDTGNVELSILNVPNFKIDETDSNGNPKSGSIIFANNVSGTDYISRPINAWMNSQPIRTLDNIQAGKAEEPTGCTGRYWNSNNVLWAPGTEAFVQHFTKTYNAKDLFVLSEPSFSATERYGKWDGSPGKKQQERYYIVDGQRFTGPTWAIQSDDFAQAVSQWNATHPDQKVTPEKTKTLAYAGGTGSGATTRHWEGKLFTVYHENGAESKTEKNPDGTPVMYDVWYEFGDMLVTPANSHPNTPIGIPTASILSIASNVVTDPDNNIQIPISGYMPSSQWIDYVDPKTGWIIEYRNAVSMDINIVLKKVVNGKHSYPNASNTFSTDGDSDASYFFGMYDLDMPSTYASYKMNFDGSISLPNSPLKNMNARTDDVFRQGTVVKTSEMMLGELMPYGNQYNESIAVINGVKGNLYVEASDMYNGIKSQDDLGNTTYTKRYVQALDPNSDYYAGAYTKPGNNKPDINNSLYSIWKSASSGSYGPKNKAIGGLQPAFTTWQEVFKYGFMDLKQQFENARTFTSLVTNSTTEKEGLIPWDSGLRYVAEGQSNKFRYNACVAGTIFFGHTDVTAPIGVQSTTFTNEAWGTSGGHILAEKSSIEEAMTTGEEQRDGTGENSPSSVKYEVGDSPKYYAIAEKGYKIKRVRKDGLQVYPAIDTQPSMSASEVTLSDGRKGLDLSELVSNLQTVVSIKVYFAPEGPTTPPPPSSEIESSGSIYEVVWDYNYDGGGKTSTLYGEFTVGNKTENQAPDGEDPSDTTNQESGTGVSYEWSVPNDPERPGYEFLGWNLDKFATYGKLHNEMQRPENAPEKHETYYAIWSPKRCTFTWDANGGTNGSTTSQDFGTSLRPGKMPTKLGYAFTGWYYDKDCTMSLTADSIVDEDMFKKNGNDYTYSCTFYAGWEADDVEVTYIDNRTGHMDTTVHHYKYDATLKLLDSVKSHEGWTFIKWDGKASDGTTLNSSVLTKVPLNPATPGVGVHDNKWTIDLTAVWRQETTPYEVFFNLDDNNNNDGARPTKVTVALISSETGAQVDEMTVSLPKTAQTFKATFPQEHKITINDTTTEPIIYTTQIKDYTDVQGNKFTIDDPHATNGNISVSAIDPNATRPEYVYKYAVNNSLKVSNEQNQNLAPQYTTSITLAHGKVTTGRDIKFTIKWNDNDNEAGKRPSSVTLLLYADNKRVEGDRGKVVINEGMCDVSSDGNSWSYTFEDYEKYDHGSIIKYTVAVVNDNESGKYSQNGYTTRYNTGSLHDAIGATISRTKETVNPVVELKWRDNNNRDGYRPSEVSIYLVAKMWNPETNKYDVNYTDLYTFTGESSTDETWSHTFENKDKYANGKEIIYSAVITGDTSSWNDPDHPLYETTVSAESNTYASITITKPDEYIDITGTVEWKDGYNIDGVRPQSIKVRLYADNVPVENPKGTVVLTGKENSTYWVANWSDLPRYAQGEEGREIVYSIRVESNGTSQPVYGTGLYDATYVDVLNQITADANQSNRPYIALNHGAEKDDYTVTITWDDNSNRNGDRPKNVTVELDAYCWNESKKTWETRYIDDFEFNWRTYSAHDDIWQYTFKNLYVNQDGQPIVYKAKIVSDLNSQIDTTTGEKEYTWTGSDLDLIVSQKVELKDVTAKIEWADNNNNDKIRPTTVIAKLYANGEPVKGLNAEQLVNNVDNSDEWEVTFKNVPRYNNLDEGKETVYSIEVIEVPGNPLYGTYNVMSNGEEETLVRYIATYRGLDENGDMIESGKIEDSKYPYVKLSHNDEQGTLKLYATWHDEENVDGIRPTQVLADIYKQVGNADPVYIKTVAITEGVDTSWSYTLSNLPVMEDSEPVLYTARISDEFKNTLDSQGYTASLEVNNIHLYHTPEVGSVSGYIEWSDNNNNDNLRPDTVLVTLVKNGEPTDKTIEVSTSLNSIEFLGVPVNYIKNGVVGTPIEYSFNVEVPEGYTVAYTPNTSTAAEDALNISVHMTHVADTRNVPITVEWNDDSDNAGVRPDSIHVQLYANGEVIPDKRIEVSGEGNIWTTEISGMPAYSNGKPIYYSARLDDNLEGIGYTKLSAGTTIYLSREPVTADMYVSFRFDDNKNADGKRPDGVYGTLTADGVPVNDSKYKHTFYYDADGHVNQFFTGLPVYSANGKYIEYNIDIEFDDEIFGGVSSEYIHSTSRNVTLDPKNNNANQVVVTLKKIADTRMVNGNILWFDANNTRGHRPERLDINVKNNVTSDYSIYTLDSVSGNVYDRDGNIVGEVSVSEWGTDGASRWYYTISGLRKNAIFENGESRLISYSITVDTTEIAPFYPTVNDGKNMNASLISESYADDVQESYQNYEIRINWLDNNNNWGYRPNARGIDVTLYANGSKYKVQHVGQENTVEGNTNVWSTVFEELPTMMNGVPVVWTVDIPDIHTYSKEINLLDYNLSTIEMTQSIGFKFDLNWLDEDNDDGVRPESVTLDILADGVKVDSITLTGENTQNKWNGSINGLPVWNATDATIPVKYTFVWSDATTGELLDNRYFAANSEGVEISEDEPFYQISATEWGVNTPESGYDLSSSSYSWTATLMRNRNRTGANVNITIDDDTDRDGLRPDKVLVQLYADGKPYGDPVEIDTSDPNSTNFTYTWSELPENEGGAPIKYTTDIVSDVAPYTKTLDETGTKVNLFYAPERISVLTNVIWDDASEVHIQYNSLGTEIGRLYGIEHKDVYVQLTADGQDIGDPVFLPADSYGTTGTIEWNDMLRYKDQGAEIEYNFRIYSEDLSTLLNDKGYTLEYGENDKYDYTATISHTYFSVTGTVYEQFGEIGDKILAPGAKVTIYKLDPESGNYISVGNATTDEDGRFQIDNVPNGVLTVRAILTDENGFQKAGTIPLIMDKTNKNVEVVINSIPSDDDNYRYSASGNAAYQTDKTNPDTIVGVPKDSIVLLYRLTEGGNTELAGVARTDSNGNYKFENLKSGSYILNYVFNYGVNAGTYTYDGADIALQFPTSNPFVINGADIEWPQAIKQVSVEIDPNDPDKPDVPVDPPIEEPKPCVTGGSVLWLDDDEDDSNNEPVVGAKVYVYTADENFYEVGKTITGEDGKWSVEGLPVGNFTAVFSYQGKQSRVIQFEITQADFDAGTYTVATQYFDKRNAETTATIKGVVLDNEGNPTKTLVQLLDADGNVINFQYTDGKGRYEFIVPAGYTYEVKALNVDIATDTIVVGNPDEEHTDLTKYILSGDVVDDDGNPVEGATVVIYKEGPAGEFTTIETATLTNKDGHYVVEVPTGGNYRVMAYKDGDKYYDKNIYVGYKDYEPKVSISGDTMHIKGDESYDKLQLIDHSTGIVRVVKTLENGEGYEFDVPKGYYEIKITKDGVEKTYWVNNPEDGNVSITHTVTVEGDVLDENGNPIVGSIVTLKDADGNTVGKPITILDGHYKFENLPNGEYTVTIEYPMTGSVVFDKFTTEPDIDGNKYPNGITPGDIWRWDVNAIQISGTVTDQDGKPIAIGKPGDAVVLIQDKTNPDNVYTASVKPDGTWTAGVPEGQYVIKAVVSFDDEHIYNSNETYNVIVNKDPVSGLDFTVNVNKLTGTVIKDADGKPIEGAEIKVTYPDGTEVPTGGITTDSDGKFEIPVFPDDYVVTVIVPGKEGEDPIESKPINVTVDGDTDVSISVDVPVKVSGIVYNPDGTPAIDAVIHYHGNGISGDVFTDGNGHYEIPLFKDDLKNEITIQGHAAGMTSDEIKLKVTTDTELDIQLNELTNKDANKTITGVVTDNEGNRLANAIVKMVYGNDKVKTFYTSTDAEGNYRFFVPDGTYYLTAEYKSGEMVYMSNAETEVEVVGKNVSQNLVVVVAYKTTIKVIDTEGKPVINAIVKYTGQIEGEGTTGTDGIVYMSIPAGQYTFTAEKGTRKSNELDVKIEKNTEITIVIPAGVLDPDNNQPEVFPTDNTISGYVFDPDGQPVQGADVTLYKFNDVTEKWEKVDGMKSESDGYYKFTGLDDGRYKVDISYTKTGDVPESNISKGNLYIDGYAQDNSGNPYVGATVNLYDEDGNLVQQVKTNDKGYYKFDNLEDGKYTVEIIPVNDEGENTKVLEDQTPKTDKINIHGVVTDVNGRPVKGATVVITGENGGKYTQITGDDGVYDFTVDPDNYKISITYPDSTEIDTETYVRPDEPDAPYLNGDSYTVMGTVRDNDGNPVEGATVILRNDKGEEIDRQITKEDGAYKFEDLDRGEYTVEIIWKGDSIIIPIVPEDPDPVGPPDYNEKMYVAGRVITDHGRKLADADVFVSTIPGAGQTATVVTQTKSGNDGFFHTDRFTKGAYSVSGSYTHKYGTNKAQGEVPIANKTVTDVVLVIVLSYEKDIDGDGIPEKIYAGEDDVFGTPDDHYPYDKDKDGTPDMDVFVGPDGKPGTPDDHYAWDLDNDGKPDIDVKIGEDGIPGTEDDWYNHDTDGDGRDDGPNDKVYIGPDTIPGTEDDWYPFDADGNGVVDKPTDKVDVGPDGIPNTPDDTYKRDNNDDGDLDDICDIIHVGDDGIPGTEDDWYINEDGEKVYPNLTFTFDGNGGLVNGVEVLKVKKVDLKSLPIATREGYTFEGWHTPDGRLAANVAFFDSLTEPTTLTAKWKSNSGTYDPTKPYYTITFDDGNGKRVIESFNNGVAPTVPNFTKSGYKIDHWVDDDGNTVDVTKPLDKDMTLTAVWTKDDGTTPSKDKYTITFNDGDGNMITRSFIKDTVPVVPTFTKPGYQIDHWVDEDGNIIDVHKPLNKDMILTAVWSELGDGTWYPWDTNKDGDLDDPNDKVNIGDDGEKGTPDDWYIWDTNKDGDTNDPTDIVYIGEDGIPGTKDDWYPHDTNKDGDLDDPNDKVFIGDDGIPGTEDDFYHKDIDGDGKDETIYVGPDGKPNTPDDWYPWDTNGDGDTDDPNDKVYVGPDGIPGTEDDWFKKDVNGDGIDDIVIVGPDGIPGTEDDIVIDGRKDVTVTIDDGFGNKSYVNVKVGTPISVIDKPIMSGYKFLGWADIYGEDLDDSTPVMNPMTIVATWKYVGASAWLETDNHFAYISGYPDGRVGPSNDITRAEVAQIFYSLLKPEIKEQFSENDKQMFKDVPLGAWYAKAVNTLSNMGVIVGVGDNRFAPNNKITRAEFATIAVRMDKLELSDSIFEDVKPDAWYYKFVTSAYKKGWVSGYGDGKFHPNANITRAEAMTLVNNVLGRKPTKETVLSFRGIMKEWPDNMNTNAWYYVAVQEATNGHLHRIWNGREEWVTVNRKML